MELRQLQYFDAVAGTCHFGRAAERLHLAQPALSQSIRRLESELGVALFTRTTRQVCLTAAGESFHSDVRRLLADLDRSVERARNISEGSQGLLRIGFTGTSAYSQLPLVARMVRAALPEVTLDVHADMLTPRQLQALLDGRLDLGVLRGPVSEPNILTRSIAQERLLLALPHDHRLVPEPALGMADLRAEPFITYSAEMSTVNEAVLASCRRADFAPRVAHRAPGTAALLALVSAGLGIALVPDSARAIQPRGVVIRELPDTASVDLSLAVRADDPSPLLARALDALESLRAEAHPRVKEDA
ncbi:MULTISPECIES: LysR substrate-binding domain-containing protein [unclassified Luteococcus]|uniref:LysR substrate-binding domain-containing protein n=1 Tax=unclassified Luteococcus TaxID=2639923 RepID=UPI00313DA527